MCSEIACVYLHPFPTLARLSAVTRRPPRPRDRWSRFASPAQAAFQHLSLLFESRGLSGTSFDRHVGLCKQARPRRAHWGDAPAARCGGVRGERGSRSIPLFLPLRPTPSSPHPPRPPTGPRTVRHGWVRDERNAGSRTMGGPPQNCPRYRRRALSPARARSAPARSSFFSGSSAAFFSPRPLVHWSGPRQHVPRCQFYCRCMLSCGASAASRLHSPSYGCSLRSTTSYADAALTSELGPPAMRALFVLWVRSGSRVPAIWDLLQRLAPRWVHLATTVAHWSATVVCGGGALAKLERGA